jgi:hypothetical protein
MVALGPANAQPDVRLLRRIHHRIESVDEEPKAPVACVRLTR